MSDRITLKKWDCSGNAEIIKNRVNTLKQALSVSIQPFAHGWGIVIACVVDVVGVVIWLTVVSVTL